MFINWTQEIETIAGFIGAFCALILTVLFSSPAGIIDWIVRVTVLMMSAIFLPNLLNDILWQKSDEIIGIISHSAVAGMFGWSAWSVALNIKRNGFAIKELSFGKIKITTKD